MKKYTYKKYPNAHLIDNWEELINLSLEQIEHLAKEWALIEKENEELHKTFRMDLNAKIEKAVSDMTNLGIDVYNYKKKGYSVVRNGFKAWFNKNVVEVIKSDYPDSFPYVPKAHMATKMVYGLEIINNQSPTDLVTLYKRVTYNYKQKKHNMQAKRVELLKAQEWVLQNQGLIDISKFSSLTDTQIISEVTDLAKEKYLNDVLSVGEKISQDICDCGVYTIGDRRCDCGNIRVSLEVEGSLSEGFYYYPEQY